MTDDPAKPRFLTIQLVRLAGAAMAVVGLLVIGGRIGWPYWAGIVLLLNGLFDVMIVPGLLARRWKSPPP